MDQGENLSQQYWVDRGHLVVKGGIDYSAKSVDNTVTQDHKNIYALPKLESYGFYRSHCLEALELTHGDVGVALEVLLSQYFKLGLKFPFIINNNSITNGNNGESATNHRSSEILQHREEEKCVLESIYDSAFEERIANRLWVLNLQLEYLLDFYSNSGGRENDWNNKRDLEEDSDSNCDRDLNMTAKSRPQICRFFAKGVCRYAQTCRFSHQPIVKRHVVPKDEKNTEKPLFQLEIRFPEGSSYPLEPALVYLTSTAGNIPPEACLQLTSRLLQEAQICARDEAPAVYSIAQLLLDRPDEMIEILKNNHFTLLDENSPLFPTLAPSPDNICGKVENTTVKICTGDGGSTQRHQQPSLYDILRDDENIVCKFLKKRHELRYIRALEGRRMLPAWNYKEVILDTVKQHQVVVICGETGCGKSTQIPQFLLDSWLLNWDSSNRRHVEIICTQPRRLSTIGVAERVAEERAEKIGNTVGYQVTFGASEDLTVKFQFTRIQSSCKTKMTSVLSLDYCNLIV